MQVIKYPERRQWKKICKRPALDVSSMEISVANILKEVKESSDAAVKRFTLMFDKVSIENAEVSLTEVKESSKLLPEELKQAIAKDLPPDIPHVFISSVTNQGLVELKDKLWQILNKPVSE